MGKITAAPIHPWEACEQALAALSEINFCLQHLVIFNPDTVIVRRPVLRQFFAPSHLGAVTVRPAIIGGICNSDIDFRSRQGGIVTFEIHPATTVVIHRSCVTVLI